MSINPLVESAEPSSASEKYLAGLWKEIIGLDQVSLPSKFLEVGGNSLTLNIILNRIETDKGASIEPQLFFDDDRSSLYLLAQELDAALATGRPAASATVCSTNGDV